MRKLQRDFSSLCKYDAKFFPCNRAGREEGSLTVCNRCMDCYEARKKAAADIRESTAEKKLIVAGPGTGCRNNRPVIKEMMMQKEGLRLRRRC
jgi:hypothetical protein